MSESNMIQNQTQPQASMPPPAGDDAAPSIQQAAGELERMMAATDAILADVLSTDSRAYLQRSRQHGGQ